MTRRCYYFLRNDASIMFMSMGIALPVERGYVIETRPAGSFSALSASIPG